MNLVRSSVSGDAAAWFRRAGAEVPGAVGPGPAPAPETLAALDLSHLAPCVHCGAMNGLSAPECWLCEADLSMRAPVPEAAAHVAEAAPADSSHLAPCPYCAAMNGLSAAACWRCEAALSQAGPIAPIAASVPAPAPAPVQVEFNAPFPFTLPRSHEPVQPPDLSAWADSAGSMRDPHEPAGPPAASDTEWRVDSVATLPAVSSAMPEGYPRIGHLLSEAEAIRRRRRRFAAMAGAGLLVLAASLVLRERFADTAVPPLAPPRAEGAEGIIAAPAPVETPEMRPAMAQSPAPTPLEAAPPKAPVRGEASRLAAAPSAQRSAAGTLRGSSRGAVRAADAAVAAPEPRPDAPERARAVAAPPGPCTPTVAALGLCGAAPIQPKE